MSEAVAETTNATAIGESVAGRIRGTRNATAATSDRSTELDSASAENKASMVGTHDRAGTAAPAASLREQREQSAPVDSRRPRDAAAPEPDRTETRERPDHSRVIAIDGAAAAGKTTVARALADRLGVTLFDTGVLYRAVTLAAIRSGFPIDDPDALANLATNRSIRVSRPSVADGRLYDVYLDDEDVTWAIRSADVDQHVSAVSAHGPVREALLPVQRNIANGAAVVMVGRDVGTVVTPHAGVKIFLLASLAERARRRHAELRARGTVVDEAFVLSDLKRRDAIDAGRTVAPLRPAPDAVLVDTDGRSVDDVVAEIEAVVRTVWERGSDTQA